MSLLDKQYTDLAAAVHVGADAPMACQGVILQAEDEDVRIRLDGTAPTTSTGLLLTAGGVPVLIPGDATAKMLRAIGVAGSKLNTSFLA